MTGTAGWSQSTLRVLDHTFGSPEENLVFDDRLLENGCETLRFWESPVYFVVLGRSARTEEDVDVAACAAANLPLLRRSSGGGTVLQGPGCLNYALVLSLTGRPELANVEGSYKVLLGRISRGLGIPGLEVCGSDVLLSGRKVSGSAQRRIKDRLLHHGTILYGLDLRLVERVLLEPRRQPTHRNHRTHRQFLTTLPVAPDDLKRRISRAFGGSSFPSLQRLGKS
jgi:lipoate-protein ligase A